MEQKAVFKEILREYDRNGTKASRLFNERQQEIYDAIPRIFEIDELLNSTGISISKKILNKESNYAYLLSSLEQRNTKLIKERKRLLIENNYPEDYLTNIYICKDCKDTGFLDSEKCHCFKQNLIDKYYYLSNLKNILKIENFDTFDLRYYSDEIDQEAGKSPLENIQKIYKSSLEFISKFDTEYSNLLFYGQSGIGKTFLSNCIAKEILDSGKTVLYVTAPQIFKMIEDHRFNRSDVEDPNEYISLLLTVDLLIIDDLGTEFSTTFTTTELFNVVNTRILDKKHCIISTNFSPEDFELNYSDRITSRLVGNYSMFNFFGSDIRLLKKYKRK